MPDAVRVVSHRGTPAPERAIGDWLWTGVPGDRAALLDRGLRLARELELPWVAASLGELKGWPLVESFLAYHFTRRYPRWASWLPRHVPRLLPTAPTEGKPVAPIFAGLKEKA